MSMHFAFFNEINLFVRNISKYLSQKKILKRISQSKKFNVHVLLSHVLHHAWSRTVLMPCDSGTMKHFGPQR